MLHVLERLQIIQRNLLRQTIQQKKMCKIPMEQQQVMMIILVQDMGMEN